ncbi:MAG: hypothetical protein V5A57_02985 [Candidatus Paceibacterota bacterium]
MCHRSNGQVHVTQEERKIIEKEEELAFNVTEVDEETALNEGVSVKTVQKIKGDLFKEVGKLGVPIDAVHCTPATPLRVIDFANRSSTEL